MKKPLWLFYYVQGDQKWNVRLTFEKLLEKDNSVTIHLRNLRILPTELFRTKENLAAPIMHEIFEQRSIHYNLRSQTDFQLGLVKQSTVV